MEHKRIHFIKFLILAALFITLSGCFTKSADQMYSLPQFSERNLQLQNLINGILGAGAEYSAPVSGANRQAVQLEDLDGDGVKEAVAFFRSSGEEQPLKVYIFQIDRDGQYQEVFRLSGEGANIESISYTDLDGDGRKEVIVGWQISSGINMLSAYLLHNDQASQLFSTDCTDYTICRLTDLTGADICVFRSGGTEAVSEAELYSLMEDGEVVSSKVPLSSTIASIDSIRTGFLSDGRSALFVESTLQSKALVTDILTYKRKRLDNISLDYESGISHTTDRIYAVYCRDIDGDGVMEIPAPLPLAEGSSFWLLEWYAFDSYGDRSLVMTTYHNYREEWYIQIPEDWYGQLAIHREDLISGERAVVLSYLASDGTTTEDFLAVYTLSGDNKEERAKYDGRFILESEGDVIYAAKILVDAGWRQLEISEELVKENFHIIYSEWMTNAT